MGDHQHAGIYIMDFIILMYRLVKGKGRGKERPSIKHSDSPHHERVSEREKKKGQVTAPPPIVHREAKRKEKEKKKKKRTRESNKQRKSTDSLYIVNFIAQPATTSTVR